MENDKETNENKNNFMSEVSTRSIKARIVFVVLLLLYLAAVIMVNVSSNKQGADGGIFINIFRTKIPFSTFTGVFSSIANMCIIFLVVLFDRPGFIISIVILIIQFPPIIFNVFSFHKYGSLPGLFTTLFTILAAILLYKNNVKIREYQKTLKEKATTDSLTGLPSRASLINLMRSLVNKEEKFVLVLVDVNNFKNINDTMGHNFGNRLLVEIASRWKELAESGTTGTKDFISRQGGDEFAIVIRDYATDAVVRKTIRFYQDELEKAITIDDRAFYLTASFGYVEYPDDTRDSHNMFSYADAAMYAVKRMGTDVHIRHFTHDLIAEAEHTNEIERKIRVALENDTIFFNMQPQYDISHNLRGFEALARMKDADGNMISPADFIPVAESAGLIDKVDSVVFRKAAGFFGEILKKVETDVILSLNVSVVHLMKRDFLKEIKSLLNDNMIPPSQLEIEITESIMIESDENAIRCLNDLKRLGVKIAIDDFGTGYSSLSYLNTIPADLLKIDKSFIDKMNTSDSSKKYVATIISIGHLMNFDVISEGVEEDAQLETLKSIGCDYIQGFIWGRPLPPDEVKALIL